MGLQARSSATPAAGCRIPRRVASQGSALAYVPGLFARRRDRSSIFLQPLSLLESRYPSSKYIIHASIELKKFSCWWIVGACLSPYSKLILYVILIIIEGHGTVRPDPVNLIKSGGIGL